jgi:hypothetical protein
MSHYVIWRVTPSLLPEAGPLRESLGYATTEAQARQFVQELTDNAARFPGFSRRPTYEYTVAHFGDS